MACMSYTWGTSLQTLSVFLVEHDYVNPFQERQGIRIVLRKYTDNAFLNLRIIVENQIFTLPYKISDFNVSYYYMFLKFKFCYFFPIFRNFHHPILCFKNLSIKNDSLISCCTSLLQSCLVSFSSRYQWSVFSLTL
jgi:hypothetical protein